MAQYELLVAESMEALAACLGPALALDLVAADDFALRPPAALSVRAALETETQPAQSFSGDGAGARRGRAARRRSRASRASG